MVCLKMSCREGKGKEWTQLGRGGENEGITRRVDEGGEGGEAEEVKDD